ncbi:hypothetical protein GC087_14650 [Pantoea sp. JZ2]|uniref:hypothetical protein n=1 Tax=Pantoea sp. JZ2 TaxID=2654189 RepID=UPI002B46712F|nr:hypothetical protein [Pantoea sp. JZ2]WRH13764.1 hypothetical protein GC087_14650 [Pantoea sp. JZ2]
MSQLSEQLAKIKPACMEARLEATILILQELVKLLSSEQREKLNEALIARCPNVQNASGGDARTIDYHLSQLIQQSISSRD